MLAVSALAGQRLAQDGYASYLGPGSAVAQVIRIELPVEKSTVHRKGTVTVNRREWKIKHCYCLTVSYVSLHVMPQVFATWSGVGNAVWWACRLREKLPLFSVEVLEHCWIVNAIDNIIERLQWAVGVKAVKIQQYQKIIKLRVRFKQLLINGLFKLLHVRQLRISLWVLLLRDWSGQEIEASVTWEPKFLVKPACLKCTCEHVPYTCREHPVVTRDRGAYKSPQVLVCGKHRQNSCIYKTGEW